MIKVGIHIYEHRKDGELISKRAYNHRHGMQMIRINNSYGMQIMAVGSEGLALAVHYRRRF